MELEQIKEIWTLRPGDVAAEIAAWDSVAGDYVREAKNNFETDPFLRFVSEKVRLDRNMSVLDVGCGAGAYAAALAERVGRVDGVDFSPEMVRLGREYAERNGLNNLHFLERNWHTCDGSEFKGKYDLVFAHTTPAIMDYTTFMKLYKASRKYCFFSRPCRRTDEVLDQLRALAGIESKTDETMSYIFDILWTLGACPEFDYSKVVWHSERKLEEAERWYLGRLKGSAEIDEKTESRILGFLREIAVDGLVREQIHTTLVNVFWSV